VSPVFSGSSLKHLTLPIPQRSLISHYRNQLGLGIPSSTSSSAVHMLKAAPSPWVSRATWDRHRATNSELVDIGYIGSRE